MTLSIIIITLNEAHNIRACLQSVDFADEIIVVDSGSEDDTVAICQALGAKVIETDWPGFGRQKNRALSLASCDWVLSLDADERVSSDLAKEIKQVIHQTSQFAAFNIPFRSRFLGRAVRFGDWRGEKHIRLFKRQQAEFDDGELHENLLIEGDVGNLSHFITHEPYLNREELIHKIEHYATKGAEVRFHQGKKATRFTAISHAAWAFCRNYIVKLGFLDGRTGFSLACAITHYTYLRYLKLKNMYSN